jgi:hypothetical protein
LEGPTGPQAYQTILEVVHQVLGVEGAALYRPGGEGRELVAAAVLDAGQVRAEGVEGKAGEHALAAQVHRSRQAQRQPGQGTALPLAYQEEVLAVLWVKGLDGEEQKEERNILWRLGQASALVLWAARLKEQLDSGQLPVDELLKMQ